MWTPADIPSQSGRVAVITGANAGLGFEVARLLAHAGAHIVMAVRDQAKASEAKARILNEAPHAAITAYELDLAAQASVLSGAQAITTDHRRIDLLVNNAGVMGLPHQRTVDGFEMQLAVNHLGHFVLTRHLLASIAAASGRVVSVTSMARLAGRHLHPVNPHLRDSYGPWRAYGQSKLACLVFAAELHRRLDAAAAPVASLAAHPGLSHTGLQQRSVEESSGGWTQRFWDTAARRVGMPIISAALPVARAATDPQATGGQLYGPRFVTFGAAVRRPVVRPSARSGRRLWGISERETGVTFDVRSILAER